MTRPKQPRQQTEHQPQSNGNGNGKRERKKVTTVTEILPAASQEEDLLTDEGEATEFDIAMEEVRDNEKLAEVLEKFAVSDVLLKVCDQTGAHCYKTTNTDIDEDFIRKHWGAGEYNVRVFIKGRYRQSIPLSIKTLLVPLDDKNPQPQQQTPTQSLELQFMKQQLDFMKDLLLGRVANAPAPTPVAELVGALNQLDQLRGRNNTGIPEETRMDIFMKGVDFAKDMTGGGPSDWKQDLFRTLRDIAPEVGKIVQGMSGKPLPAAPAALQTATPGEAAAAAVVEPVLTGDADMDAKTIFKHKVIPDLKKQFLEGVDPELIVDWVANHLNDPNYQFLIRFALNTDFRAICDLDPEITQEPYLSRFKSLYDGLRSIHNGEGDVDDDKGGESGDPGHTKPNGNISTFIKPGGGQPS